MSHIDSALPQPAIVLSCRLRALRPCIQMGVPFLNAMNDLTGLFVLSYEAGRGM